MSLGEQWNDGYILSISRLFTKDIINFFGPFNLTLLHIGCRLDFTI